MVILYRHLWGGTVREVPCRAGAASEIRSRIICVLTDLDLGPNLSVWRSGSAIRPKFTRRFSKTHVTGWYVEYRAVRVPRNEIRDWDFGVLSDSS